MNAIRRHQYMRALEELVEGVQTIPSAGVSYTDYDTVLAVQRALLAKGYKLPKYGADGDLGSETVSAIKAMQKDAGLSQTGVIDYGVLMALGVKAPSSTPTRSTAGSSASAARKDVQAVADNAAKAADDAETAFEVQQAAAQVKAVAEQAAPPPPPEVQAKVAKAQAKAKAASTPAEVKEAKKELQEAAQEVQQAVGAGTWYERRVLGLPLWQVLLGGVGVAALGVGVYGVMRKR